MEFGNQRPYQQELHHVSTGSSSGSSSSNSMLPALLFIPSRGPPVKALDAICWRSLEGRPCLTPQDRRLACSTAVVIIPVCTKRRQKGAAAGSDGATATTPTQERNTSDSAPASLQTTHTSPHHPADAGPHFADSRNKPAPGLNCTASAQSVVQAPADASACSTGPNPDPVHAACAAAATSLDAQAIPHTLDTNPKLSSGAKFHLWEQRGVALRVEVGPREAALGLASVAVHPHYAGLPRVKEAVHAVRQRYGALAARTSGCKPAASEDGKVAGWQAPQASSSSGDCQQNVQHTDQSTVATPDWGDVAVILCKATVPLAMLGQACGEVLAACREERQLGAQGAASTCPPCAKLHIFNPKHLHPTTHCNTQHQAHEATSGRYGEHEQLYRPMNMGAEGTGSVGRLAPWSTSPTAGLDATGPLPPESTVSDEVCTAHLQYLVGAGRACHCGIGHIPLSALKYELARQYAAAHPGEAIVEWARRHLHGSGDQDQPAIASKHQGMGGKKGSGRSTQQREGAERLPEAEGQGSMQEGRAEQGACESCQARQSKGEEKGYGEAGDDEADVEGHGDCINVFVSRVPLDFPAAALQAQLMRAFAPFGGNKVSLSRTRNGCTHGWAKVLVPNMVQALAAIRALDGQMRLQLQNSRDDSASASSNAAAAVGLATACNSTTAVATVAAGSTSGTRGSGAGEDGSGCRTGARQPAAAAGPAASESRLPPASQPPDDEASTTDTTDPRATGLSAASNSCGMALQVSLPTGRRDALFPWVAYKQRRRLRIDAVASYSVTDQPTAERMAGLVATVAAVLWSLPAPGDTMTVPHSSTSQSPAQTPPDGLLPPGGLPPLSGTAPLSSPSLSPPSSAPLPLYITDGTACCGGNTLALLRAFGHVCAVELDEDRFEDLVHNLNVMGYHCLDAGMGRMPAQGQRSAGMAAADAPACVKVACGDYVQLSQVLRQHVVFLDPPWGGPQYSQHMGQAQPLSQHPPAQRQATVQCASNGATGCAAAASGNGLSLGDKPIASLCIDLLTPAASALSAAQAPATGDQATGGHLLQSLGDCSEQQRDGSCAVAGQQLMPTGQPVSRAKQYEAVRRNHSDCLGASGMEGRVMGMVALKLPSKLDCVQLCQEVAAELQHHLQQRRQPWPAERAAAEAAGGWQQPAALQLLAVHAQFGRSSLLMLGLPMFRLGLCSQDGSVGRAEQTLLGKSLAALATPPSQELSPCGIAAGVIDALQASVSGTEAVQAKLRSALKTWMVANPGVPCRLVRF